MDPKAREALDRYVTERRERAHSYLAGVDAAAMYPMGRGSGTILIDEYGDSHLDFAAGGQFLLTGHRDEQVRNAIFTQANQHVYQSVYGEYLDHSLLRYAELLSGRFPPDDEGNPRKVLFLASNYEARLSAAHMCAMQGKGGAFIEYLDVDGSLRDGGEVQDFVHKSRAHGAYLVSDETLTGCGRTGKFCCYEMFAFTPDIVVLGPVVGAGIPMSAVVAPGRFFTPEFHRTFAELYGVWPTINPLACAAGWAMMSQVTDEMLAHVRQVGEVFEADLNEVVSQFDRILVRSEGVGLIRTLHLTHPSWAMMFRDFCRRSGLLVHPNLRLTPPLNCTEDQVKAAVDAVAAACIEVGAAMKVDA